jgi:hypothetical protein
MYVVLVYRLRRWRAALEQRRKAVSCSYRRRRRSSAQRGGFRRRCTTLESGKVEVAGETLAAIILD